MNIDFAYTPVLNARGFAHDNLFLCKFETVSTAAGNNLMQNIIAGVRCHDVIKSKMATSRAKYKTKWLQKARRNNSKT